MSTHRRPRHHRSRCLGIGLLILGLVHAPWPQADFHNVRHHDTPGQVCEHHDHLLRWHPDAGQAEDVAILHWHWYLPSSGPVEPGHSGPGPLLHAYADGWEATALDSGPTFVADLSSRPIDPPASDPPSTVADPFAPPVDPFGPRDGAGPAHAFGSTFAPRVSPASRLQRWNC